MLAAGYNGDLAAPIRIAYLVSRYPATNHTFILREIVALRSLGLDVDVIAIRGADRPRDRMTELERQEQQRTFTVLPPGAHVLTAHIATLFSNPIGYLRGLFCALELARWNIKLVFSHLIYFAEAVVAGSMMRSRGIQHMHSHFSSTVALLAERVFKLNFSITIHGPDEFNDVIGFHMREKVAASSFIVAISDFARSQILRATDPKDWSKVEVCRLGVDPTLFSPNPPRPPNTPRNLIFVGRLAPVKAQRVLISACARVVAGGRDLRLRLVGSGPDHQDLEKFAAACGMGGRVTLEGPRNQDEVLEFYRQSDIFALASFAEGVPVVLMEAMAMQVPCVATWVNGIPELIEHQVSGLLVPPADEERLAAAIERLIDDPDGARELGRKGREEVLNRYNLATNTEALAAVFRRRLQA